MLRGCHLGWWPLRGVAQNCSSIKIQVSCHFFPMAEWHALPPSAPGNCCRGLDLFRQRCRGALGRPVWWITLLFPYFSHLSGMFGYDMNLGKCEYIEVKAKKTNLYLNQFHFRSRKEVARKRFSGRSASASPSPSSSLATSSSGEPLWNLQPSSKLRN